MKKNSFLEDYLNKEENDTEKLFEKFIKENYKGVDFQVEEVKEDDKYYFCYLYSSELYDVPKLVMDKKTKEIKSEVLPPFTDDSKAKTIYRATKFKK